MILQSNSEDAERYCREYLESMTVQELQKKYTDEKVTVRAIDNCLLHPKKHSHKDLKRWESVKLNLLDSLLRIKDVIRDKAYTAAMG